MRVQACKIDDYRAKGINLDKIEAMKVAEIIDMSGANIVYVDSLEQNSKKFKQLIVKHLQNKDVELVVENYMDESVPVVSAASIIAKVERDRVVEEIKQKVGFDFGAGYSHDSRTIDFVEALLKKSSKLPNYVRQSWITTQVLKEKSWQRKLKDFILSNEDFKEE